MQRPSRPALRLGLALAATGAIAAALAAQTAAATPQVSAFAPAAQGKANSSYLAGYQATQPSISRASVGFYVPQMTCTDATEGTAAGIGNEQTEGAPTLLGIVWDACFSGAPDHTIQATAGGHTHFGDAAEGDRIKVRVVQTPSRVKVVVTDLTTATSVRASGVPTPDNSLTIGSFPLFSSAILPVADFGRMRMLNSTLNHSGLAASLPTKLNRHGGGTVQIATGGFSPIGAFPLTFRNH